MSRSNREPLRIAVVGMGPVGTTLAAHLIKAGAYVVLCDLDRTRIEAMARDGIRLENKIQMEVKVSQVAFSISELEKHDLDLVAVAVKTPALGEVVSQIAKIPSDRLAVMCTQNGLDNEQEVARQIGEDRTLRMVINYAGGMSTPSSVHLIFFNPPNYIAAMTAQGQSIVQRVVELLNVAGLTSEIPDNIQKYVWEKAILNSALSPVCALSGQTMGDVMDFYQGSALVRELLDESIRVAEAEGIKLADGFLDYSYAYLKGGGYHRPSMLVDLENNLPTEIDRLNGRIAEYGRKNGIPTPYHQTIAALVRLRELPSK